MFNLIRMDIHRLVHSVSTWVTVAVAVILAVFCVAMTNNDIQTMTNAPQPTVTETSEERQIGIVVETNPEWVDGDIDIGEIISIEMRSGLLALLCIIFAAIFSNAEQKNGYVKNIAGLFPRRAKLIASKFVAIAVQVFLLLFVFTIFTALTGLILWGDRLYLGSVVTVFRFLGVQYLLHLGFASLIMFLCYLTRSSAFSMTAGILVTSGLAVPIYSLVNKLIYDIKPSWNFDVNKYMLDGNITMIGLDAAPSAMLRGAIVGGAFILFSVFCAMVIMKKRDIR